MDACFGLANGMRTELFFERTKKYALPFKGLRAREISSRVTSHFVPITTVAVGGHDQGSSPGPGLSVSPVTTSGSTSTSSPTRAFGLPYSEMPFFKSLVLDWKQPLKFQSSPCAPPPPSFPPSAFIATSTSIQFILVDNDRRACSYPSSR